VINLTRPTKEKYREGRRLIKYIAITCIPSYLSCLGKAVS